MPEHISTKAKKPPQCKQCGTLMVRKNTTISGKGLSGSGDDTVIGYWSQACECVTDGEDDLDGIKRRQAEWERSFAIGRAGGQVPNSWRRMTIDDLDWDPERAPDLVKHGKVLRHYLATLSDRVRAGEGLCLFGNPGTVKSTFGCVALTAAADLGIAGDFRTAIEICEGLDYRNPIRMDFRKRLLEIPLLVLDEIGGETVSTHSGACLLDVIDTRYREKRATIVTWNTQAPTVSKAYDDIGGNAPRVSPVQWMIDRYASIGDNQAMAKIFGRLREQNVWLQFTGPSYREFIRPTWHKEVQP